MALIFLHEHIGGPRTAQVYKWANGLCYEVKMAEMGKPEDSKTFNTEQEAENFAEDWVLETQEQKPKKSKKNNDE